jgi:hypothetical protein
MLLTEVKQANKLWFSPDSQAFSHDKQYWVMESGSGEFYLVRSTEAWTDMFGQEPRLHYRINEIDQDTKEVKSLIDDEFANMFDVETWLESN